MANQGKGSFNGKNANDIHVEIDLQALATRLAADPNFIKLVSNKIRKEMTKDVRTMGNLFGKWAGK